MNYIEMEYEEAQEINQKILTLLFNEDYQNLNDVYYTFNRLVQNLIANLSSMHKDPIMIYEAYLKLHKMNEHKFEECLTKAISYLKNQGEVK